jgi:type I restriction enzyme S subunit
LVPLRDVCSFRHGGTPSKSNPAFWGGDIPWVSPKDMKSSVLTSTQDSITPEGVTGSATSIVPEGAILVVARSGILAHTLPVAIAGRPLSFNQDIKAIQVSDARLSSAYVYWFLKGKAPEVIAKGVKKGATVHSLVSGFLERLRIPLAAPSEQRRIVELLSRAENVVRMRREAETKAKEIVPALFLDMFGDPATNPKGWEVRRFGELVDRFQGGKNVQAGSPGDSEFRILKISAVTSGKYDESESKPAPGGSSPPPHYFVREGDILFSRANTEELVGATAMVVSTDGRSLLPDKLWRLVWRPDARVRPAYMLALLQNLSTRKALSNIASGTGGSMKNISQAKLSKLRLPIAPMDTQIAFERNAASVNSLLGGARRAGAVADQAFQSLLAGVFGEEQ